MRAISISYSASGDETQCHKPQIIFIKHFHKNFIKSVIITRQIEIIYEVIRLSVPLAETKLKGQFCNTDDSDFHASLFELLSNGREFCDSWRDYVCQIVLKNAMTAKSEQRASNQRKAQFSTGWNSKLWVFDSLTLSFKCHHVIVIDEK